MAICSRCQEVLQQDPMPNSANHGTGWTSCRYHHRTVAGYIDAVDKRCFICRKFFEGLSPVGQLRLREVAAKTQQRVSFPLEGHFTALFVCSHRLQTTYWISLGLVFICSALYSELGIDTVIAAEQRIGLIALGCGSEDDGTEIVTPSHDKYHHYPPQSTRNDSEETFSAIRTWIRECDEKHPVCRSQNQEGDWRPTRLLDIGRASSDLVSLVRGANMRRGQTYASISHRWGTSSSILKLTTDNLGEFEQGVPLESLPQSFRDCILVARKLGIEYIWIDSLCIIQSGDGGRDWLHESAQMHRVYSNASCNVMASWASSSETMFATREPGAFDWLSTDLPITLRANEPPTQVTFISVDDSLWSNEVSNSPLNRRAWVLQERLLSRRNLHFTRRQVFWECPEKARCESISELRFPEGTPFGHIDDSDIKALHWQPGPSTHRESFAEPEPHAADCPPQNSAVYEKWNGIVRVYTRADLTFASDKLVALGGVSRQIKALLGDSDTYVAGLWLRYLSAELLWEVDADQQAAILQSYFDSPSERSEPYRAPSFCWSSTDYPVIPCAGPFPSDTILVDVCCVRYRPPAVLVNRDTWTDEPITEDLFGPFSEPQVELRVTGRIIPAKLVLHKSESRARVKPLKFCAQHSRPEPDPRDYQDFFIQARTDLAMASLDGLFCELDPKSDVEEDLCRLPCFYIPWWDGSGEEGADDAGMHSYCVLVQLVDAEFGRFRRIGVMSLDKKRSDYHMNWEVSGHDKRVKSWHYDEASGKHTVYIV
ncbi:heterokaryon incompatibility protein-domain-containing protein [Immersiella caudata]|uniref:Heterokaryon incompatibility protein-domain-containing protein n=1 Tax=Immersiella caudata TaxID=314043 RepID=A0AA39WVN6_9PEZI|nr:heterokaryon incompatibility protein-domain-containing protein [Immersiella caudata]